MDQGCGRSCPSPGCGSGNADRDWASQPQHAVERMDGDVHLGRPAPVRARAQPVADDLLGSPDARLVQPDAFCQAARSCSAMPGEPLGSTHCRWRSRCVGSVSAVSLGTAEERGSTMIAAAG